MSADIVNLRRARKAKARAEKEQRAAENRVLFGRSKTERTISAAEKVRSLAAHEGLRLSPVSTASPATACDAAPEPPEADAAPSHPTRIG